MNNKTVKIIIHIILIAAMIQMSIIVYNIYLIHKKEIDERNYINSFKSSEYQNSTQDDSFLNNNLPYNKHRIDSNDLNIDLDNIGNDSINDNITDNNSNDNLNNDYTTKYNNKKPANSCDCIIEIPDINLSKIVYTGKDREKHLENYELITAAYDMEYSQGGNYIICGHASRLYGHSLNRIKEIKKGAAINIINSNKTDKYIVDKVYYSDMMDTDKYCRQTNNREITIISCAKYVSKESYIVIKALPR